MATPTDARQRRTKPHQPYPPSFPSHESHQASSPSLRSRYQQARASAPLARLIAMRALELSLTALALLVASSVIHHLVRSLDTLHDLLGRRARSAFDAFSWREYLLGIVALGAWHGVLVVLSWRALAPGKKATAGTGIRRALGVVLGRVVVPGYLVLGFVMWAYALTSRDSAVAVKGEGHAGA